MDIKILMAVRVRIHKDGDKEVYLCDFINDSLDHDGLDLFMGDDIIHSVLREDIVNILLYQEPKN